MKRFLPSVFLKIIKWTGILILCLLGVLFIAPYLFPDTISKEIKAFANKSIKGQVNFSKARLSFFKHFPSFTFTLSDFSLKGSAPYADDTLVAAREISLGINLSSLLFEKKINIDKIFLSQAMVMIKISEQGMANYNVFESDTSQHLESKSDSGTSLKLEKIVLTNTRLIYNDLSAPLLIDAMGLNYTGKGDLSKDLFALYSQLNIDSINFHLNRSAYLLHKKINAELVTRINTNSLDFFFERNDLKINQLSLQFKGRLKFLKTGMFFDLSLQSNKSDLHDFITALPPSYLVWLQRTKVQGEAECKASFKGNYIVSEKLMPTLTCAAKIRNGLIAYDNAPVPLSNCYADFEMSLPSLNTDSLKLKLDSFSINLGKQNSAGKILTVGIDKPFIAGKINARLNLEELDKALGLGPIRMKGYLSMDAEANGKYERVVVKRGIRNKERMVLTSIPRFNLKAKWTNGYLKYDSLPEALNAIYLSVRASCPDNNYKKITLKIDTVSAKIVKSFVHGSAALSGIENFPLEARLESEIDLSEFKKSIPIDSLELAGTSKISISLAGKYNPKEKLFPRLATNISLKDGMILTKYYPHPIQHIEFNMQSEDKTADMHGLSIILQPSSLQFEGKGIELYGKVRDFDDPLYEIKARGEIDLEKIYKVFALKGMDLSGIIKANLLLSGRQSETLHGDYARLNNSGSLECKNLSFSHEYFSKPFLISEGKFDFKQEKMWFSHFTAKYGQSDLSLDGYLTNAVNYFFGEKETLSGNFNLKSQFISLDEFTSFASIDSLSGKPAKTPASDTIFQESGVIMIPSSLDLTIKATVDKLQLNGTDFTQLNGGVLINNGKVKLTETSFNLIGSNVLMDGLYGNTSPRRAYFEYHLQANDFDVKRAYREIKIFHNLASSAANAEGIISLDYQLKGKLNGKMYPIYPSLAGEGTVSIKNVKVKGLKLFNVVSSKTEKQELKDPELSKINIHSKIRNNIIYIDRFKFKTSGFRIRVEGQTSFDNNIHFKIRVGLPPLGIIGIPISATGNAENPQVKLGKNDKAGLSEVEDKDDEN